MATASIFKRTAIKAPTKRIAKSGLTPVQSFIKRAEDQVAAAEAVKAGSGVIEPRKHWFRQVGNSYEVQLGRDALKIDGERYFRVESLDVVGQLLGEAIERAETDKDFIKNIEAAAKARSERLKRNK